MRVVLFATYFAKSMRFEASSNIFNAMKHTGGGGGGKGGGGGGGEGGEFFLQLVLL